MLRTLSLVALVLVGSAHADATVVSLLTEYQRSSGVPVAGLDEATLSRLLTGEVVYRKVSVATPSAEGDSTSLRVIGYRLIHEPREPLWLAALAFDAGYTSRLTEKLVETNDTGGGDWYQHLDMPWPLKDRHWLIRTQKTTELANSSSGRLWEHQWSLVPDARTRILELFESGPIGGVTEQKAAKSVELPLNNGAWVMGQIDEDRTLVIVHATVDLGGIVPDSLVARQTRKNLIRMLGKIEVDAPEAWSNYTEQYLIYRGDGSLIVPRASDNAEVG
ncbi:MAG: hypothetical protein AAFN07_01110 [Pseudomonadota bacterium]